LEGAIDYSRCKRQNQRPAYGLVVYPRRRAWYFDLSALSVGGHPQQVK